jgi:XTP/dITP diphosphohydrolase
MKKILIGTHNKGKFKEISYLISKKYKKISPNSLKIKSPKETGKSFTSNSKLKVSYFSKFVDYPVISDDSGLCIKALNNKPGIYSARLAKKHGGFLNAMKFILRKMKKKKKRSATFVCCLSYKDKKRKIISVEGKLEGNISTKILGKKGFGYDPIFIP